MYILSQVVSQAIPENGAAEISRVLAVWNIVKWWGPILGALFALVKFGFWARKQYDDIRDSVSGWAHQLLNNHMIHIQAATEASAKTLEAVKELSAAAARSLEEHRLAEREHYTSSIKVLGEIRDVVQESKEITEDTAKRAEDVADKVAMVAESLKDHEKLEDDVQNRILLGIEVLKDRT